MKRTAGQEWWYRKIEGRAYHRLTQLRRPRPDGGAPLWDGVPPVPVEHVAEHLLGLSITYDKIDEEEGEEILGCLRAEGKEIVLNERHADRFQRNPGTERHTIGHEIGHADVFGDVADATEQLAIPELCGAYRPRKRSAIRGDVRVLKITMTAAMKQRLDACEPEVREEVMRRWAERDRERSAGDQDTPLVRRAVDHYAATLLMPEEAVRSAACTLDLASWRSITELAARFGVSKQSMRIRLEELGFIYGVDESNRIMLENPAEADQFRLW